MTNSSVEGFAVAEQVLQPGAALVFDTADFLPNQMGLIGHRNQTPEYVLSGNGYQSRGCGCCQRSSTNYLVLFSGNIAVPAGGTPGEVQLSFAVDGTSLPYTIMRATPAAAEEYFNVACITSVPVWNSCCQFLTVVNSGTAPVSVREGNINIFYAD